MKNLNIFSLVEEYENAKSGEVLDVPNVSFVDEDNSVRYLLKYDYVDLGLPSGLKWAKCNVGADSPEKTGLYFAWGETVGYTAEQVTAGERVFDDATYKTGPAASISTDLTLEQDAAHVNMGGNWRMPTIAEFMELRDNCNIVWTIDYNGTGIKGRTFTSKINGNSVFFPAAGYCSNSSVIYAGMNGNYWSASWYDFSKVWRLYFNSAGHFLDNPIRYFGFSVRGVCE